MAIEVTDRDRAKALRREALLRESARLFATRGFSAVSLEDLGAAVGVSGPAVYRHFSGKQALLGALLIDVSQRFHDGGAAVIARDVTPRERLRELIQFHVTFALSQSDVIRVQDRDLAQLSPTDHDSVRRLQRAYIQSWMNALSDVVPSLDASELRLRVQAGFGLINSTPHSVGSNTHAPDTAATLIAMTTAALLASREDGGYVFAPATF